MPNFLSHCQHWVFDMDGTLTLAVHDFQYIRKRLAIPEHADILGHLSSLPRAEAQAKHRWLWEHEHQLAQASKAAPGAIELVQTLHAQGHQLAILTRNAHDLAHVTLQAIGLLPYFKPDAILGREQAKPKPDPDGMLKIAQLWRVPPQQLTMVGDFHFDLSSAKAAGARSVLVNTATNLWPELADYHALDCHRLLTALAQR